MASKYERDKKAIMRYQKAKTSRVVINLKNEEKKEWENIAASSGMPLATLIRKLMKEYTLENQVK